MRKSLRTGRSLNNILDCSRNKQNSELALQHLNLKEIPDLSSFVWVTKLDLSSNRITNIEKRKLPPNLTYLDVSKTDIYVIMHTDLPDSLECLNLALTNITNFDGSNFSNIKELCLSNNKLNSFSFPPNSTIVDVSDNELKFLPKFPESLEKMFCSENDLCSILINNNLKEIDFSSNSIDDFPEFADGITYVDGSKNSISELLKLPSGLEVLKLRDCRITQLACELPPSLLILDLCDNMIIEMPDLPSNIQEVDLSDNRIDSLKVIPESVKILDVSNNCLTELPEELKKRDITLDYAKNFIDSDSNDSNDDIDLDLFWAPDNKNDSTTTNNYSGYKVENLHSPYRNTRTYHGTNYNNYNYSYNDEYEGYGNYGGYYSTYNNNYRFRNDSILRSTSKAKNNNPNYVSFGNNKTREV